MQAQFSLSVPFPQPCFLFLLLFCYFYSTTLLTLPVPWAALSLPSIHTPPPLSLSWVCRQLLSGKVTLCVISAFHGSPLSLQRVIISFRVKGSICYKRTRASGMERVRVGAWGGEGRRTEVIGWQRVRTVGEKGDEGWEWKGMTGWDMKPRERGRKNVWVRTSQNVLSVFWTHCSQRGAFV